MWFAIAFGVLPFRYNTKLQQITPSKYYLIYSVFINALIVIASVCAWPWKEFLDLDLLSNYKLIEILTRVTVVLNIYTLTIVFRIKFRAYKSVLDIFNEFATIERVYYANYAAIARKCTTYDNYIILKGLATFLQNISFIFILFITPIESNVNAVVVLIFTIILGNIIFLVVLLFYNCVITTYRYIWILQRRLQNIADYGAKSRHSSVVTREIYEITAAYMRLLKVCKGFGGVYGHQLLISIGAIMCANIQTLYYFRILWNEKVTELALLDIFYIFQAVAINIFDFWLNFTVCELALGVARDMAQSLRSFTNLAQLDVELERSLEVLATVCRNNVPEFRLCGLIDLNHLNGLKTLQTMVLYLIYLVQFSYKDF
ncbi:gustatory receptor for bitter taste 22e-like [Anastrepha ludens]|uniref:gustatory receptor for bitter taste 22e-like n=1 Tax=Anastrepha ludens TaxID=28586 RepID=UPI0023AEA93C|nr:gustatory receptor for bitter taste 22e-like [Anastrepha ludens]